MSLRTRRDEEETGRTRVITTETRWKEYNLSCRRNEFTLECRKNLGRTELGGETKVKSTNKESVREKTRRNEHEDKGKGNLANLSLRNPRCSTDKKPNHLETIEGSERTRDEWRCGRAVEREGRAKRGQRESRRWEDGARR